MLPDSNYKMESNNKGAHQYDTNYIVYGLHKNVSETMSFFNEIEQSQSDAFTDKHVTNIVNKKLPILGIEPTTSI